MKNEYVMYKGTNYQIMRIWQHGSIEIASLRPVGYTHVIHVPTVNLDV